MDIALMIDSVPRLLGASVLTLQLVGLSLAIGFFTGLGLALMRLSPNLPSTAFASSFIFVFRGTPLLVQMSLIYYGVGQFEFVRDSFLWPFLREPFWCAILALTLNTTAYSSEIFRGGILSVPHGQVEAARACGMSRLLAFRRIILPQALRQSLPAYSNEMILMVKASSLASTITLMDLTGAASRIISRTFAVFEIFIVAAAIYLAINFVIATAVRRLEWRLTPHLRRTP